MSFGPFLNGFYDVGRQLPDWLLRSAEACAAHEEAEKRTLTRETFITRRDRIRDAFIESIGGLDFPRTDLKPVCTRVMPRQGYEVRAIVFQSLPGFHVTANLYVPTDAVTPMPAVVFACGHDEASKASPLYQQVCIALARAGIVAFAVDPVSQGERMQYYDRAAGRNVVRWHAEHTYAGLQCELAGASIIRYFVHDLVRSIDYLETLSEVDPARIGMTGNSGGGMQTAYTMLVDPRLAAAMPCTFITSREHYMKTGQPQDGEQNIYCAIRDGINYDDFISAFAPKPAMIGAVESDFFVVEGVLRTYERARAAYRLFGAEPAVELGLVPGTHAYNDALRRVAVAFFRKAFFESGAGPAAADVPEAVEVSELQCTASGQVLAEYDDARTVRDLNADYLDAHPRTRPRSPSELSERVRRFLALPACDAPIRPRVVNERRIDNSENLMSALVHRDVFFFSEPDTAVCGTRVSVAGRDADRCSILLLETGAVGIQKENDLVNRLLGDGDLFAFDPRGCGAVQSRPVNGRPFYEMYGTEYKLGCDAMMLGRSLTGLRVFDVLRAAQYLREASPGVRVGLAGVGYGAVYALLAAALIDDVDGVYLENMIDSFDDLARRDRYFYDAHYHLYGVLRHFDLPDIVAALSRRTRVERVTTPDVGNTIRW